MKDACVWNCEIRMITFNRNDSWDADSRDVSEIKADLWKGRRRGHYCSFVTELWLLKVNVMLKVIIKHTQEDLDGSQIIRYGFVEKGPSSSHPIYIDPEFLWGVSQVLPPQLRTLTVSSVAYDLLPPRRVQISGRAVLVLILQFYPVLDSITVLCYDRLPPCPIVASCWSAYTF